MENNCNNNNSNEINAPTSKKLHKLQLNFSRFSSSWVCATRRRSLSVCPSITCITELASQYGSANVLSLCAIRCALYAWVVFGICFCFGSSSRRCSYCYIINHAVVVVYIILYYCCCNDDDVDCGIFDGAPPLEFVYFLFDFVYVCMYQIVYIYKYFFLYFIYIYVDYIQQKNIF